MPTHTCKFLTQSDVKDKRYTPSKNAIRRRRECTICGKRATSYETIAIPPVST